MRTSLLSLAGLALWLAGCGEDCEPSADARVTIEGSAPEMSLVKALIVGVKVGQGTRQLYRLDLTETLQPGRAVLLTPSVAIPGDTYRLALDITGLLADGTPVVTGKTEKDLGTKACNQVSLALMGLGGDQDLAMSLGDLAGADLSSPPDQSMPQDLAGTADLAPCVATTPDEDGDGRGDQCDVCAANADPTLTDGDVDGVPDVCDPAPATAGNKAVYFQAFNAMPAGWTGTFTVTGGDAQISGNAGAFVDTTAAASDPAAALPAGVLMQTYGTATAITSGIDGGIRVFLWTNVGTAGFRCSAEVQSVGQPVVRVTELGVGSTGANLAATFAAGQRLRYRLWQQGTVIGCEVANANGSSPTTVMRNIAAAPAGPLRPGVGVGFQSYSNSGSITAKFSSVFAVTYP